MLQKLTPAAWMALTLICFTGAAGIAWQKTPTPVHSIHQQQDTLPKKHASNEDETIIDGDLDKALEDTKKAQESLGKQLEGKDWEKMQQDLQKAQQELSAVNIHEQLEKALKNINLQQIQVETQAAIQKIDWEKMQQDLEHAQAALRNNIDSKKIDPDIEKILEVNKKALLKLQTIDMKKIQAELEKTTSLLVFNEDRMKKDVERAGKDIEANRRHDFKKELEHAKDEVNNVTAMLQNYNAMLDEMVKESLLQSKESYNIEYNKGELLIDGKKQSHTIADKYKYYFKKDRVILKRDSKEENSRTIHL